MKKLIISTVLALVLVAVMVAPAMAAQEDSVTASASVSEYVSISLSGGIGFTGLNPGDTDVEADSSPAITITVLPETNVTVDIGIKGTDTDGIDIENWAYNTDGGATTTALSGTYATAYDNVGVGTNDFYHFISVPTGIASGTYHATVWYKAVEDGESY